jgi:hypothetical protein
MFDELHQTDEMIAIDGINRSAKLDLAAPWY